MSRRRRPRASRPGARARTSGSAVLSNSLGRLLGGKTESEARHAAHLLVGTGATALLGVIYGVYATRRLDTASVGEFTHALSIIALLRVGLGPINATVARFAAQYASTGPVGKVRTLVHEVARRSARYGLVALIPALLLSVPLADFWRYRSPAPLQLAFLTIYATLLLNVARGALRGLKRFGSFNVSTISEAACRLVLGIGLLSMWVDTSAAVASYLFGVVAALLLSMPSLRKVWDGIAPEPVNGTAIRRFVGPMALLMATSAVLQNMDMQVAKRFFDVEATATYGIAFYLTGQAMAVLVAPFNTLILPLVAGAPGPARKRRAIVFRVSAAFVSLAALPLFVLAIWPGELIELLYDDRFIQASPLLLPLAGARLMGSLNHLLVLAGAATGRFSFLAVYCAGALGELVALAIWHATPAQTAVVVLAAQTLLLVSLLAQMWSPLGGPSARSTGRDA